MPLIWAVLKSSSLLLHPQVLNQLLAASRLPQAYPHHPPSLASTLTPPRPILLCHSPLLSPPVPLLHGPPHTAGPTQPSTPPLPPSPTAPSFVSVVRSRQEQSQSTLAVQDGGADFMVVDRKEMKKGTTERSRSKQQFPERNRGEH